MAKAELDLWVSKTFSIELSRLANPSPGAATTKARPAPKAPAADGTPEVRSLKLPKLPIPTPADLLDDVLDDLEKDLNGPFTCTGTIQNNTGETLFLDASSVKSCFEGEYETLPPGKIARNDSAQFKAAGTEAVPIPLLGRLTRTGTEGLIRYFVGEDKLTVWTIYFNVPRIGKNKVEGDHGKCGLEGDKAGDLQQIAKPGSGNDAKFNYELIDDGTPDTPPNNTPAGAAASCLVTVTNATQLVLTLREQGHVNGDFMSFPPSSLAPGASGQFVSVHTPGGKQPGCKGFALFEAGTPPAATWRIGWDNEVGAQNTVAVNLDPASAGFKSLNQIGQGDENVPVAFTLSGGTAPTPVVPPTPDPAFAPPAKPGQPTLRKGDKSPDGWVEYAQQCLNHHLNAGLTVDGNFGNGTLAAVHKFQKAKKLQDDGVIGNQTWAALREGAPEKVGTDGRQPHTFEQTGKQGRFTTEGGSNCYYVTAEDTLTLRIVSVGEESIEGSPVTVRVTQPDGTSKTQITPVGPVDGKTADGQGELHSAALPKFLSVFGIKAPATVKECLIDTYLDKEIGGDTISVHPEIH